MKKIIINDSNLTDDDIESKVVRVKALILNSKGKVLLAQNNNTYQFIGGHLEENESMNECIIREISEESGIDLEVTEEPFLCISTYDNNYFGTGKKVLNSIYYFRFFTDLLPDASKTKYDELELTTDFKLYYLNFFMLEKFLKKCIINGSIDANIGREMILVCQEYDNIFGGNN